MPVVIHVGSKSDTKRDINRSPLNLSTRRSRTPTHRRKSKVKLFKRRSKSKLRTESLRKHIGKSLRRRTFGSAKNGEYFTDYLSDYSPAQSQSPVAGNLEQFIVYSNTPPSRRNSSSYQWDVTPDTASTNKGLDENVNTVEFCEFSAGIVATCHDCCCWRCNSRIQLDDHDQSHNLSFDSPVASVRDILRWRETTPPVKTDDYPGNKKNKSRSSNITETESSEHISSNLKDTLQQSTDSMHRFSASSATQIPLELTKNKKKKRSRKKKKTLLTTNVAIEAVKQAYSNQPNQDENISVLLCVNCNYQSSRCTFYVPSSCTWARLLKIIISQKHFINVPQIPFSIVCHDWAGGDENADVPLNASQQWVVTKRFLKARKLLHKKKKNGNYIVHMITDNQ